MIELRHVTKQYGQDTALHDISLVIPNGEVHGIIGLSGAGKSTLLKSMNLLEIPTSGEVFVDGKLLTSLSSKQLRNARKSIGMIFQHFNLLLNKTVYENVALPLQLSGLSKQMAKIRVEECLRFVGLETFAKKYPNQLSGGQKQRVAIARALATKPSILLCDEITSALDPSTTEEVLQVLKTVNEQLGVTIVLVSHEMKVIKSICQRVTVLEQGKLYETISIKPDGVTHIGNSAQRLVNELKGGM